MIRLRGLEFRYGLDDFRLRVPSLDVEKEEAVAIVGRSGSGKTTLLHLIAAILRPRLGTIEVGGTEVSSLPDAERRAFRIRRVGLVFQEFELVEYLNVLDNILLPYRLHPDLRLSREVRARAESLAGELGLAAKLSRSPRRLSQGERQRVAVCRALLPAPPLVLADEPTGNLDRDNSERVLDGFFRLIREQGATLVTVTHDESLLPRFDRSLDLDDLLEAGGPADG